LEIYFSPFLLTGVADVDVQKDNWVVGTLQLRLNLVPVGHFE
jgi:hypothetical protein